MRKNVLNLRYALFWIGIGAISGYVVAHPFGMPQAAFKPMYELVLPLLGKFRGKAYFDLALAAFVYALPTIFLLGLVLGLSLKRAAEKRLLTYSILVWPVIYFLKSTVLIYLMKRGEAITSQGAAASSFLSEKFAAEMNLYCLEYALLFALIFAVHAVSTREKPHNTSLDSAAMRRSA